MAKSICLWCNVERDTRVAQFEADHLEMDVDDSGISISDNVIPTGTRTTHPYFMSSVSSSSTKIMFPRLAPTRPQAQTQSQPFKTQIRTATSAEPRPQSQIEAMPPHLAPVQRPMNNSEGGSKL